jgi:transcriptional regulator with XRE-family HTH domain
MQDPAYGAVFRQARRGRQLTQVAIAEALGVSQSYIAQIEAGRSFPSPELAVRISELLGIRAPGQDAGRMPMLREDVHALSAFSAAVRTRRRRRVPIVGVPVPGDDERITVDPHSPGATLTMPQFENVPGAQALYVRGRSMEPRYYPGELVYFDPTRVPNPGDFVFVLLREPQFAAPIGYIRQYLGEDGGQLRLATLNPKRETLIDRSAVVSIATIIGSSLL